MFKNKKGFIIKLRQSRTFKGLSICLALNLLFEVIQPTAALALTEGPSQPESQSFEPFSTTQMVDMFTGDFNYNIPLFNLPGPNGGYPVNLAYHAGVSMDDEASWVGLGWNINAGSLVRSMRGLPDEFQSVASGDDPITAAADHDYLDVQSDMMQSWTLGMNVGVSAEILGGDLSATGLSMGESVYYNNYNGVGISLDPSVSMGGPGSSTFSVGLSLDTENGLGVSASFSISSGREEACKSAQLGFSFDGNLSMNCSLKGHVEGWSSARDDFNNSASIGSSMSFARDNFIPSIQNRVNSYNIGVNVKLGVEAGAFANTSWGLFFNTQDFNDQDKKGRKRLVSGYAKSSASTDNRYTRDFIRNNDGQITKATMYLPNTQYAYDVYNSSGQGLNGYFRARRSDIGRSFDPYVYNETDGFNGSFELGVPTGLQGEVGFGIGANYGYSMQGAWNENNTLNFDFKNPDPSPENGRKENVYYQAHGEQTILNKNELDYMQGLGLIGLTLVPKWSDGLIPGTRSVSNAGTGSYASERNVGERVVRNTLIHNLKNSEVALLGEFKVNYFTNASQSLSYPTSGTTLSLNRSTRKIDDNNVKIDDHPAGFKVLNQEGSYYVYGLPAYNTKEVENFYSTKNSTGTSAENVENITSLDPNAQTDNKENYKVDGTNKYINKTTKSPYAHSYLLTAVQGADYVDVKNDGCTDDDLGYWVKFNYLTPTETEKFKWRTPYENDQYNAGSLWTPEDDKASYQYGEKELWYLAQIETKSHIAVFKMSPRGDMQGAKGENVFDGIASQAGMKIDEIRVYDKATFKANPNCVALQVVHFKYADPSTPIDPMIPLCPATPNAIQGKLTLQQVWFTSNGSTRGKLNKYKFDYSSPTLDPSIYDNPNYAANSYDPWRGYKPKGPTNSYGHHVHFPYVNQFNQNWSSNVWEPAYTDDKESFQAKKLTQETQDDLVSAWSLKKITLPSGGTINVKYESDDYGYVQHKTANQMFKIEKMGDDSGRGDFEIYHEGDDDAGDYYDEASITDEERRRVYFKLEYPISALSSTVEEASNRVYKDYILPIIKDEGGQRNLYFKSKIRLVDESYDYVSGYLPLEDAFYTYGSSASHYNFGIKTNSIESIDIDGDGVEEPCYTRGFVTVKATKKKNGNYFDKYHPMALAAWTYLQTNAQKLLHESSSFGSLSANPTGVEEVASFLGDFMSIIPATASSFGNIRHYCRNKNLAQSLDLNSSVIRLASPDKKKFGGGHRVKEISITDNWSGDTGSPDATYGQHYDYTIEENGKIISSGVAQYEPQAGGDENALKYPMYYFDKQNLFTKNNLFAEAPLNESLFPGASVGYRKVTVKSLNTNTQIRNKIAQDAGSTTSPPKGRTGGVTVHEFYTAKEFPTIVETSLLSESENTKDYFNVPIPIPLIGSIKRLHYHGVQSYKIELNDMHGKPKSVESFEMNGYVVNPSPITSTKYEYQCVPIIQNGEMVFQLDNNVAIIANDGTHKELIEGGQVAKRLMGVEVDVSTDQRETKSFQTSGSFNNNVVLEGVPFPSFWVTYTNSKTLFRTYVTNKVVHKTGILKKTITRDLQTTNETEILAYDEKSGNPLLSRIKNEFGDDFYSYNIPAYYAYDRMGHSYQNINYNFTTTLSQINISDNETVNFSINPSEIDNLVRGDEFLIQKNGTATADEYKKAYFIGWDYGAGGTTPVKGILHVDGGLSSPNSSVILRVIRSGWRNHSASMAANYLTKGKINATTETALSSSIVTTALDGSTISPLSLTTIQGNVLSATASLYKDDWLTTDIGENTDLKVIDNPFLTGNSGIFRPYKSYTYVGKRSQNDGATKFAADNTSNNPALYNDGVMSNVPMFSWDIGNLEEYVSNWEWVNEVMKFSHDAYEVENVNRLGIYSSALYGYDNSLTIGVGGNASYLELGVIDFETHPSNTWDLGESMKQTNLNFYNGVNSITQFMSLEHFNIKSATYNSSGLIEVLVKMPYSYYTSIAPRLENNYGLTLNSTKKNTEKGNKDIYFNATCPGDKNEQAHGSGCPSQEVIIGGVSYTKVTLNPIYANSTNNLMLLANGSEYTGKIGFLINRPVTTDDNTATSSTAFVNSKAHTGKKSMQINNTVRYDQFKLKLINNKKYITSMWISRDNTDVSTYVTSTFFPPVTVGVVSGGIFNAIPTTNAKYTFGKIIEGWQKIDVEFSVASDNPVMSIQFTPGTNPLYVDDIRFSPKTGGITTYVYDPVKYWLRASLNVDNYATLFFYDEEGNLTLKKQETEKGIFTITESRGHVSEGN